MGVCLWVVCVFEGCFGVYMCVYWWGGMGWLGRVGCVKRV